MKWKNDTKTNRKIWALPVIFGFIYLLLDVLLLEKLFFSIKKFTIGNVDSDQPIRILHISDLHFKRSFNWKYQRLIRKIFQLQPDLLIITGDAIDRSGKLAPLQKFLARLPNQMTKVAILGNHDHLSNVSTAQLQQTYRDFGVDYLVNETKTFNLRQTKLAVTGLDDFVEGQDNFDKAFKNVNGVGNHIILLHNPKHIDKLSPFLKQLNHLKSNKEKISPKLLLSGHTHGGQIKIDSFTPGLPVSSGKYVEGWYETEFGNLYINRGIGTSTIPVRFGARSEVTIFNYYPGQN